MLIAILTQKAHDQELPGLQLTQRCSGENDGNIFRINFFSCVLSILGRAQSVIAAEGGFIED